MKKIFVLLLLFAIAALSATNKEIEEYVSGGLKANRAITIKSVKVVSREAVKSLNGWEIVRVLIDVTVDRNGLKQPIKTTDTLFVKGNILAPELIDVKKNKSLKDLFRPKLPSEYADAEHLIVGSKEAKYKIVVFSDPLCPFCRDFMPDIIAAALKSPRKIALYHYSFPLLSLHPASETIVKAELVVAKKFKNKADFFKKLYSLDIQPNEPDQNKIIQTFNGQFGTKLSKQDVQSSTALKAYDAETQRGYQMMVQGTPTVYVNGEIDDGRLKTQEILKEVQ